MRLNKSPNKTASDNAPIVPRYVSALLTHKKTVVTLFGDTLSIISRAIAALNALRVSTHPIPTTVLNENGKQTSWRTRLGYSQNMNAIAFNYLAHVLCFPGWVLGLYCHIRSWLPSKSVPLCSLKAGMQKLVLIKTAPRKVNIPPKTYDLGYFARTIQTKIELPHPLHKMFGDRLIVCTQIWLQKYTWDIQSKYILN